MLLHCLGTKSKSSKRTVVTVQEFSDNLSTVFQAVSQVRQPKQNVACWSRVNAIEMLSRLSVAIRLLAT